MQARAAVPPSDVLEYDRFGPNPQDVKYDCFSWTELQGKNSMWGSPCVAPSLSPLSAMLLSHTTLAYVILLTVFNEKVKNYENASNALLSTSCNACLISCS